MYNESLHHWGIHVWQFYDRRIPTVMMLTLTSVIGIPGNLLVVLVNCKEKKMSNTNFLIFTMAFVDFIAACTAVLNVLHMTLWFQILDIRFCKFTIMLSYSINTPGVFLIFGVSVVRYYHVCKPQEVHSIHSKVICFNIYVLAHTLCVAVLFSICSGKIPWRDDAIPGFDCDIHTEGTCGRVINIYLIISTMLYVFFLNGLIGLNIRILRRLFQQRKVMSSYKTVRKNKHSQAKQDKIVKRASQHESTSIHETTDSPLTSINDSNDPIDDKTNPKDTSIHDNKSAKSEDNESCDLSLEDKTETFTEHQKHPGRKSTKIKGKLRKSVELYMEKDHDNIKTKFMTNDVTQKEFREGDSSKSDRLSERNIGSVKNNDTNPDNKQNVHTKGVSFAHRGIHDRKLNEQEPDKQLEKRCYCKRCLHKFKNLFEFEGFNRTTLKLFFVSIAYIVIYLPWFVVQGIQLAEVVSEDANPLLFKYYYIPISYLPFAGCAVNPVIYAFVDPKFRSQCKNLFR